MMSPKVLKRTGHSGCHVSLGFSILWLLAVLILHGMGSSTAGAQKPAIRSHPPEALLDELIQLQLSGLRPKQTVTLRAQVDARGQLWQSHASFVADEDGKVDVSKQAPVRGTYSTVDPMGLFWSMEAGKVDVEGTERAPLDLTVERIRTYVGES